MAAVDRQADAAVLRQALLGDVEVGHDLHAADDAVDHAARAPWSRSASTPSMRKRTRICVPSGARWMSEAPCSTAWAMIWLTSLMTGASSADSRRSTISAVVLLGLHRRRSATTSSRRVSRLIRPAMSSREATAGADLEAGHQRDVVDGQDVGRVGHRDEQRALAEERRPGPPRSGGPRRLLMRFAAPMSTLKIVRSRWSRPWRSAIARESAAWVMVAALEQDRARGSSSCRGRWRSPSSTRSRGDEPELDDDVGEEPRAAAAGARRGDAGGRRRGGGVEVRGLRRAAGGGSRSSQGGGGPASCPRAASRMTSIGATVRSSGSKLSAPWRTRISSPSTTRHPWSRAAVIELRVAGAG